MHNNDTLFVGKVFLRFQRLDSTNLYAQNLITKSKPLEGTVISTLEQYAGRGQIGSKWESEPGKNITCSIIFYPHFLPIKHQFQLNQVFSLAIADLLTKYTEKTINVKWPNDVYVDHKKIAGILIQNAILGKNIHSSVVGMGINVNQTEFLRFGRPATSIKLLTNKTVDLSEIESELCQKVEFRYLQLKEGKIAEIEEAYLSILYRIGEESRFKTPDGTEFSGKIIGIGANGVLKIQTEQKILAFAFKEVGFAD